MFNKHDISRDACQLYGPQSKRGYDWWWHSFTGINEKTGKEKSFFVEYFLCNPLYGGDEPVFGQLEKNRESGIRPSYLMVKAGAWGRMPPKSIDSSDGTTLKYHIKHHFQ